MNFSWIQIRSNYQRITFCHTGDESSGHLRKDKPSFPLIINSSICFGISQLKTHHPVWSLPVLFWTLPPLVRIYKTHASFVGSNSSSFPPLPGLSEPEFGLAVPPPFPPPFLAGTTFSPLWATGYYFPRHRSCFSAPFLDELHFLWCSFIIQEIYPSTCHLILLNIRGGWRGWRMWVSSTSGLSWLKLWVKPHISLNIP